MTNMKTTNTTLEVVSLERPRISAKVLAIIQTQKASFRMNQIAKNVKPPPFRYSGYRRC